MRIKLVGSNYYEAKDGDPVRLTAMGRAAILSALAAGNEVLIKIDECEVVVTPPVRH
jgi:hypothetical protein